jgi:protein involved in polysaccharide export with SLBB domain
MSLAPVGASMTRLQEDRMRTPSVSSRRWLVPVALGLVAVLASCASRPPVIPVKPARLDPNAPYQIKMGDYLDIRFYKTPEMNVEVPVRSDGKISLEILGDVQAAGLTPEALSASLNQRYASELTDPRVTVIVRAFGGQIFVGGEVKTPSAVPFATGMTALQAIAGAGGFLGTAKPDEVVLIRKSESGEQRSQKLELERALTGEDPSVDIALQPSDIIHVPRKGVATVNLFVDQYIRQNIPINPSAVGAAF